MSPAHKGLIGLTILATVGLVAFWASRRFSFEARKTEILLLEMLTNVSSDLEKLDAKFEDMSTQAEIARSRLRQLVALHRENLFVCAILRERRGRRTSRLRKRMVHNEVGERG